MTQRLLLFLGDAEPYTLTVRDERVYDARDREVTLERETPAGWRRARYDDVEVGYRLRTVVVEHGHTIQLGDTVRGVFLYDDAMNPALERALRDAGFEPTRLVVVGRFTRPRLQPTAALNLEAVLSEQLAVPVEVVT